MLTKEQLIDAHEQGLIINTRNGNIKIVAILNDIYGVNHCDTNSKLVKWWMFENFERNEAKIEQPKPKYNGRAVKCDTVEQFIWILNKLESKHIKYGKENYEAKFNCIDLTKGTLYTTCENFDYYDKRNYEIISFSQYCTENGINEPKWIQGFKVGKDYNDVVMVSDDNKNWEISRLLNVRECTHPFLTERFSFKYCRYLNKEEINEIKFN